MGPPWGLRKPWEPLKAFISLQQPWVFSQTQGPCFPCSPHPCSLLLLLAPPHPLSLPGPLWAPGTFLGPQQALGAFGSLRQPCVFSQTQGPCFPCFPSPPSLPLTPPCPLSLPGPLWVPGTFLGPQKALGAFRSLWQACVFSQTQGPCFPCSSLPPLTLSHSLSLPLAP